MRRVRIIAIWVLAAVHAGPSVATELIVDPLEATVGTRLRASVEFTVPDGGSFEPPQIGPDLGPFQVFDGRWYAPAEHAPGRWIWRGWLAAYETGEFTVPTIRLTAVVDGEPTVVETPPVEVRIVTVLRDDSDFAGLKDTVSLIADHGPLMLGVGAVLALLALSGAAWWFHRRYGQRLTAVAVPEDVFRRRPPHVWVYDELKRLLDARLLEQGQLERFYEELARIVKQYAGGRFRVDLMERTTGEVPAALRQAGAPENAVMSLSVLLREADAIKFAGTTPDPTGCRAAVERAYGIVDATKPREDAATDAREGAA